MAGEISFFGWRFEECGPPTYAKMTTVPDITPKERTRFLEGLGKTLEELAQINED